MLSKWILKLAIGIPLELHQLTFHTRVNAFQTAQEHVFVVGGKQLLNVIFELVPFESGQSPKLRST